MKYRIAIQEYGGNNKPSGFRNVMIESWLSLDEVREEIASFFRDEVELHKAGFNNLWLKSNGDKNIKQFVRSDHFDKESVGNDITPEEFLMNEIDAVRRGQ